MHRLALIGLGLLAATGCTFESTGFDYQSTLYTRTNGVALKGYDEMYGGHRAQVGMNSMTCEIDQRTAMLGNDYDYAMTDDDKVTDAGQIGDDNVVLVTTPDRVHVQFSDDWYGGSETLTVPGVQNALVTNAGPVVLADEGGNCAVKWVGVGSDASRTLGAGACSDFTLTVDPGSGDAFVGSDTGVTHETTSGSAVLTEDASQIVAWDAAAQVLYAAEYGATTLRGLEADGTQRFATEVGASILAVDDLGSRGAAIVSVSFADGTGGVVVVDGLTGAIEASQGTPSAVASVVGAPDGGSVALVDTDQVHFYSVGALFDTLGDEGESDLDPILGF